MTVEPLGTVASTPTYDTFYVSTWTWLGPWSSGTAYVLNDAVFNAANGSSYICILAVGPTATLPSADPTHWSLMAQKGDTGAQGTQGIQGIQGIPGVEGPEGDQGPQGIQGIQGIPGTAGAQGPKGDTGDTGAQGIPGTPGATGAAGADGAAGPQGIPGTAGATGSTGPPGPAGVAAIGGHTEYLPANGVTFIDLPETPTALLVVARGGLIQSEVEGHYSLAGQRITFSDALDGAERVVVSYAVGGDLSGTDSPLRTYVADIMSILDPGGVPAP